MKKLTVFLSVLTLGTMLSAASYAVEPADISFEQNPNGKYIYCNNHERIRSTDLADRSNEYAKFIMNNEGLTADNYALFCSFMNQTDLDKNDKPTGKKGFDIEVDVLFKAQEDTAVTISRLGFEVPQHRSIFLEANQYYTEDEWGCFSCWATYLGYPIKQINSGNVYEPLDFEPITIKIPAGECVWLSDYIDNYCEVPWARSVNIVSDFSIDSGKCDVNVAALRGTGKIGDRSNFNPKSAFGSYVRDYQHKGISDGLNEVTAKIEYTINDSDAEGKLPVTVYNHYKPEGNTLTDFYTHLNSRNDPWSYELCADSDMLSFKYYDPLKREYYGSVVPESEKDDYYYFDINHTDLAKYSKEYGNASTYIPNAELTEDTPREYSCSMGNYGVIYNYDIKIKNEGNIKRYFIYKLATSSNMLVYVKDKDGNVLGDRVLSKGRTEIRLSDDMACVPIAPQAETEYTICVVLAPNYSGGMQNAFYLSNFPSIIETYQTQRGGIRKDKYFTGREYYNWDGGKLNISYDRENWTCVELPMQVIDEIRDNFNEYTLTWSGNGYIIKPSLYDAGWYVHVNDNFKYIYLLNDDFTLREKKNLGSYPQGAVCAKGVYYVQAANAVYFLQNNGKWKITADGLPCWNYGYNAVMTDGGMIKSSADGVNFSETVYKGFKPDYVDSLGNYYFFAEGRTLYLSENGLYWRSVNFNEPVETFEIMDGKVIANGKEQRDLPEFNENVLLKYEGKYIATENECLLIDDMPYLPLRETAEMMGYTVNWNEGIITVEKDGSGYTLTDSDNCFNLEGTMYIPFEKIKNFSNAEVTYNADGRTVEIN